MTLTNFMVRCSAYSPPTTSAKQSQCLWLLEPVGEEEMTALYCVQRIIMAKLEIEVFQIKIQSRERN